MGRVWPIRRPRGSVLSSRSWRFGVAGSPRRRSINRGDNISFYADPGTSTQVTAASIRWECGRCEVSAGQIDGTRSALPAGWTGSGEKTFCLSCSRALAGEAAEDLAPAGTTRDELVRIRRRGLIEFEIGRAPDAPNRKIAQACRTSTGAVAAVREAAEDA